LYLRRLVFDPNGDIAVILAHLADKERCVTATQDNVALRASVEENLRTRFEVDDVIERQRYFAEQGIDCVLAEPQFNPGLVATVLDGTQAQTGILDPLGSDLEPGPALYPQLIRNLSTALAGCM